MRFSRVGVWGLLLFALVSVSWGQTGTSTIRGTLTDPQGRVVAGAKVTLTNTANNGVRTTTSTDSGAFVFDLITPGDYRVDIEAKGFKKQSIGSVQALIGKPTDASTQLEIGTAGEVVEVTSSSQEVLVNTQDATLGNNFISEQITQLPLEARNLVDLLSLQPGSTREGYVTGARADQSNVTLDGVDINNAQTGNAEVPRQTNGLLIGSLDNDRGNITTGPVLRLNAEAIDEFRVTTANGNANQGRSSGSQVNLVTKAGTNSWHGAASEFYRSRGFTANDWFNNHADPVVPRTPLVRNTYGGAIGGPVIKNRAFFFYSYEARHDASGTSESRQVPLASLGQGIINYNYCTQVDSGNNCIGSVLLSPTPLTQADNAAAFSAVGLNPDAIAALADAAAKYPANDPTNTDGLNVGGFRFNAPTPTRLNSHVGKLDFNLTKNQTAFVRANVIYDHQTLPQWLPDQPSPLVWSHPWGVAAGHTWTLGNRWVNNFRYGYTRQAFTQGGDSFGNDVDFRFVFQQTGETHGSSRVTPVHNITDDLSYIRGNHNIQFGVNIRRVNNSRVSFANAFDFAEANPSFYMGTGSNIPSAFQAELDSSPLFKGNAGNGEKLASAIEVRNAGTALIGRFSELTSNFTFGKTGDLLPAGSPTIRNFATQAYDSYVQDTWRVRPRLTLTLGLRYSLERPVYETQGFEVQPTVPLGQYFAARLAAGKQGQNFVDPIVINRSGPANNGKPMYNWDKNNFQPRIAVAWSLDPQSKSVLRGGFALTNDYYGQALAVDWDLNNTLGFTSNFTNHANTFDTTSLAAAGPLFTAFGQDVRSLIPSAGGSVPGNLAFPLSASPLDGSSEFGERIESSLDSNLHAPSQYVWNLTFERSLPKGAVLSMSYIGRMGRSLLAHRDVAQFNNLHDPATGLDWYAAGTALEKLRQQGTDISAVPGLLPANVNQYFNNMFPAGMASIIGDYDGLTYDPGWSNAQAYYGEYQLNDVFHGNDWTDVQAEADLAMVFNAGGDRTALRFMQPQYGALSTWSTIGNANYHALAISLRQRINTLTMDFNYTWSHSLDDASGLQSEGGYGNYFTQGSFIPNGIRQHDNYASSDFDVRHTINADLVWQMPFGKGRMLLGSVNRAVDAIFGGWQLSSIFRWNTGLPVTAGFIDDGRWSTNWNVQSYVTPVRPVHSCPNKPVNGTPKIFGACGVDQIYQNFRNAYPGETGARNYFRYPGYVDLDIGLGKSWKMPYNEGHQVQLRWDVFNVTNTQHLTGIQNNGVEEDPGLHHASAPGDFSNFAGTQGQPRIMQVGVRYSF